MTPTDTVESLTPARARGLLRQLDDKQRPLSLINLAHLSDMVKRWGWHPWLTRVVLSEEGTVLDGQHTLTWVANQAKDSSWPTRIIRGVPRGMVSVIGDYSVEFGLDND